jgi:Rrf2 family protein
MSADGYRTLLKRDESYAVHALLYVAGHPGAPAARIAEDLDLPRDFLAKVLRRLGRAGFVRNNPGRTGGVHLSVDLGALSLLDVIEAVSGPLVLDTCQTLEHCPNQQRTGRCALNGAWHDVCGKVRGAFDDVRLDQLVATQGAPSHGEHGEHANPAGA